MEEILCSWARRFNILKMPILSKLIYTVNAIKMTSRLFYKYWQADSKSYMKMQRAKNTQNVSEKKKKLKDYHGLNSSVLYNYNDQDNVVLASKSKNKSM